MGHDVVMGTYHDVTMNIDVLGPLFIMYITIPKYYISIFLVKSLKLYIKH